MENKNIIVFTLILLLLGGIYVIGKSSIFAQGTGFSFIDSVMSIFRGRPSCTAGYKCYSPTVLGYQNKKCKWSNLYTCQYGCLNNACYFNTTCEERFSCSGSILVHQLKDCSNVTQNCPFGCANNACLPDPCTKVSCPDVCQDTTNMKINGTCSGGTCQYTTIPCPNGCSNGSCIPTTLSEFTEGNANDWDLDTGFPSNISADYSRKQVGKSSIKTETGDGFDYWILYPRNKDLNRDICEKKYISFFLYVENKNEFQGNWPEIRIYSSSTDYLKLQPEYDLMGSCKNKWCTINAPLNGGEGWMKSVVGSYSCNNIKYFEFHADTWDYGFKYWLDGLNFTENEVYPIPKFKVNQNTSYVVPVLVLNYFPTQDGTWLDQGITGIFSTIDAERKHTMDLTNQLVGNLTYASAYHIYKNPNSQASLFYSVYETKEFLKPVPLSATFPKYADLFEMFSNSAVGVSDICDYIDNKGVKEVWVWMYHTDSTIPWESNMAMGTISKSYWNYGTYGDVSNSNRQNDMPTCSKTYTVYEYNYGREVGMALEDHDHQIEALFSYVDNSIWGNLFVGSCGSQSFYRCGWTHYPPNVMQYCNGHDYDWLNTATSLSDCEDWKPDGTGLKKYVNCQTWTDYMYPGIGHCIDDEGVAFKIWWMQNIPGRNNYLTYVGCDMRNWWDFIGDFDSAMGQGKSLTNC